MPAFTRGLISVILIGTFAVASAQLPPEIRADAYLLRVEQAVRDGDLDRARTVISNIRTLQEQHELDLRDEFHFRYAKAARSIGMSDLALESVVKYLAEAGREGQHYAEALELLNTAPAGSSRVDVSAQLSPDVVADTDLLAAEQAIRDGNLARARTAIQDLRSLSEQHDLNLSDEFHFRYAKAAGAVDSPEHALESVVKYLAAAGREGEHYSEALELMNSAQVAVSCKGWDTEGYFKTATLEEVNACLDTGVNLELHDDSGATALHRAAKNAQNADVIQALIDVGVDKDAVDSNKSTPLHWAAGYDNPAAIKALLKAGADANARDKAKQTPLHRAVQVTRNPVVIQHLIDAGADIIAMDNNGRTLLHVGVQFDNSIAINALVAAGADLESPDKHGQTPLSTAVMDGRSAAVEILINAGANRSSVKERWNTLHWAVSYNDDPDAIRALIRGGANVKARDRDKWRPLHVAAKFNRNPGVINALIEAGADPDARTKNRLTPLHCAARFNNSPDVVRALIDAGGDLDARGRDDDDTPLFIATKHAQNPDVVKVLIEAVADPEFRDESYKAAIRTAAMYNENPEIVTGLVEAIAEPEAREESRKATILMAASNNPNPLVVKELLEHVSNPESREDRRNAALRNAAWKNENPDVAGALMAAGADPNARDDSGWTPLYFAAGWNQNPDVLSRLIGAGADPNVRGDDGRTPLHLAADWNHNPEVARVLIDAGADLSARYKGSITPLDMAVNNKNPDVARVLREAGATLTKTDEKPKQGTDWGKVAVGVLGGAAIIHAGKDAPSEVTEQALADWITVMSGADPATDVSGETSGGSAPQPAAGDRKHKCEVPGYYDRNFGDMSRLGLPWCQSSVGFQTRAFALQIAGMWCDIYSGKLSPSQIETRKAQIRQVCDKLDAMAPENGVQHVCGCDLVPGVRP